jgi:glycylpeptide N-tetradecanoyltransferase
VCSQENSVSLCFLFDGVVLYVFSYVCCFAPTDRSKRLAPVLIKEVTRRVNLQDRWQAVYTAGVVLPKPVARCQYFHRSINPKKLFEVSRILYIQEGSEINRK